MFKMKKSGAATIGKTIAKTPEAHRQLMFS